jgi:hypothetical protein
MSAMGGLGQLLGRGWKALAPKSVGEALIDFGPDLAFAGFAASQADPGYKFGVGAEDLGLGLGMSLVGRGMGRFAGQRFMGLRGEALQMPTNVGSMLVSMPASVFGPRPTMDAMFKARAEQEQQGGQLAAPLEPSSVAGLPQAAEADLMRNQLINSILMGTSLGAGGLDLQRAGGALT